MSAAGCAQNQFQGRPRKFKFPPQPGSRRRIQRAAVTVVFQKVLLSQQQFFQLGDGGVQRKIKQGVPEHIREAFRSPAQRSAHRHHMADAILHRFINVHGLLMRFGVGVV